MSWRQARSLLRSGTVRTVTLGSHGVVALRTDRGECVTGEPESGDVIRAIRRLAPNASEIAIEWE